uniref:Stabilizer of axonemal microtubules 2 n=1 Tax=Latimeria chalumnae TaxID=7897 RepID=H3B3D8_LATCH
KNLNMAQTAGLEKVGFPEFTCLCELCDCGRHKHHKNCKNRNNITQKMFVLFSNEGKNSAQQQQQLTWCTRDFRLRSSKRPLRTPPHPNPPPMNFDTTQRREFIPWQINLSEPCKKKEYYQPSQEPLQNVTVYSLDFPAKQPVVTLVRRPATNVQLNQSQFSKSTTSKEFFKTWKPEPQIRYGELPAIIGSLLYPDQTDEMKTTNQQEFVQKFGSKPEMVKNAPCNIKIEGEHTMTTTHKTAYQPLPLEKLDLCKPTQKDRVLLFKQGHMETLTKYRSDFSDYRSLPAKNAPVPPPLDNLGINHNFRTTKKFTFKILSTDFKTVQREAFHGWDTSRYRRPNLSSHVTNTTMMQPLQLSKVHLEPIKRPRTLLKVNNAKFEDATVNKYFFKDWGVQPRIRYGDSHDGVFIKPL